MSRATSARHRAKVTVWRRLVDYWTAGRRPSRLHLYVPAGWDGAW